MSKSNVYLTKPKGEDPTPPPVHTSCGATLYVCVDNESVPLPKGCTLDPAILPAGLTKEQMLLVVDIIETWMEANPPPTLTPKEVITIMEESGLLCKECFTKDGIYDMIKQFLSSNGCECLSTDEIVKIIIQAIEANQDEVVLTIIKAIHSHSDAVKVEDAFGAHLFHAIP